MSRSVENHHVCDETVADPDSTGNGITVYYGKEMEIRIDDTSEVYCSASMLELTYTLIDKIWLEKRKFIVVRTYEEATRFGFVRDLRRLELANLNPTKGY